MLQVRAVECVGIQEDRHGIVERDAVFRRVGLGLPRVPLEHVFSIYGMPGKLGATDQGGRRPCHTFDPVDREKLLKGPTAPTEANLLYPQISRMDLPPNVGAHNVFPLLGMPIAEFAKEKDNVRDMLAIVDEATGRDCATSARAMMWIADITTETKPLGVANWTVCTSSR